MSDAPHFSDDEKRILAALLDEMIPSDATRGLPGAGEAGIGDHIEGALGRSPDVFPGIQQGLATLSRLVADRGAGALAQLPAEDRAVVVNELSEAEPILIPSLTFHAYTGYYQHEKVSRALGLEGRPPHPRGYELETGDLSLLDPVREREKLYREV